MRVLCILAMTLAATCSAVGCGGGGSEGPDIVVVTWAGDFAEPARPLVIRRGEIPAPFGPAAVQYTLLRLSPGGELVAAVVESQGGPGVMLIPLRGGEPRPLAAAAGDGPVQEIAWSPDGRFLAVAGGTTVRVFERATGAERAALAVEGRLFGPLGGDGWAPDSSAFAAGVSNGIMVLAPGVAPQHVGYEDAPFEERSAAFSGWHGREVLIRDLSTGIFYSHPVGDVTSGWRATVPADPQAAFVALLEEASRALYELLPGATITSTRPTADRSGVVVTGWAAESGATIQQGPFRAAVAVARAGEEPLALDLGKVASFGLVQEGRLVDAAIVGR